MSLFPYMFREMIRPLRLLEHQMRMAEEFFPTMYPMIRYQNKPLLEISENTQNESIVHDKEKFQLKLDVQHFAPQEISVKTVDGNAIVIEGKHEEKEDDKGYIARQFVRRFVLPKGHDMTNVVSSLSSDGILTITAPRKVGPALEEKVIPITHIGPEKNEKEEKEEKKSESQ